MFKHSLDFENYSVFITDNRFRITFTRIEQSSHDTEIETKVNIQIYPKNKEFVEFDKKLIETGYQFNRSALDIVIRKKYLNGITSSGQHYKNMFLI